MITLYQPPRPEGWGIPNVSPFCVKLETYLKMAKLDYEVAPADVFKAPNGRVPYVKIDNEIFGDTTLIIRELKKRFGDPVDGALTHEQELRSILLQALVENRMYFAGAFLRFNDENSWRYVRDFFKSVLPPVIGNLIVKLIRKDMLKSMRVQGTGEHRREDVIDFAKRDFTALSDLLGPQPFFLGSEPSSIDASIYGFTIQILWSPWDGPLKGHVASLKNLVSFCERMKQRFWSKV